VSEPVCRLQRTRRISVLWTVPPTSGGRGRLGGSGGSTCRSGSGPSEVLDQLREAGSLERTATDALGSVVSVIETLIKRTFLDRVTGGDAIITKMGNFFQRLDDSAQLFRDQWTTWS